MPAVVRNIGRAKLARNVDGEEVRRSDRLMVGHDWIACLDTDNHFVYKSRRIGSSLLCTCGSPAITVGFRQYRQYASYMGNEVVMCQSLANSGKHSDGST